MHFIAVLSTGVFFTLSLSVPRGLIPICSSVDSCRRDQRFYFYVSAAYSRSDTESGFWTACGLWQLVLTLNLCCWRGSGLWQADRVSVRTVHRMRKHCARLNARNRYYPLYCSLILAVLYFWCWLCAFGLYMLLSLIVHFVYYLFI